MFDAADRLPTCEVSGYVSEVEWEPPRPWGLGRMAEFASVMAVGDVAGERDLVAQTGGSVEAVGRSAEAKHRKTQRATERTTQTTPPGDGDRPRSDEDHEQDAEED